MKYCVQILLLTLVTAGCNTAVVKNTPSALKEISNSNIENKHYGEEATNWNVHPVQEYKSPPYHSPTPTSHPTAKLINTYDLNKQITSKNKPVMINVLGGEKYSRKSIPTSVWMKGFGRIPKDNDNINLQRFTNQLSKLSNNNKNTPLVFYCFDSMCWLSYNACLKATELGYSNIYWYRGGTAAWKSAGLPFVSTGVYRN